MLKLWRKRISPVPNLLDSELDDTSTRESIGVEAAPEYDLASPLTQVPDIVEVVGAESAGPRTILIGTSNAVFGEGFSKELSAPGKFSSFVSRSIGYCSSSLFAYQMSSIDFKDYDICILDFACNDASLALSNDLSIEAIRVQLQEAVSVIAQAGCLPVLVVLPVRWCLTAGRDVPAVYREVAAECNIPFFDGYELLDHLEREGLPAHSQFLDDMHLKLDLARDIGSGLVTGLMAVWHGSRDKSEIEIAGFRHQAFRAASLAQGRLPVTTYTTKLLKCDALVVTATALPVELPGQTEIVALAVNFAQSCGVLRVEGERPYAIRLTTEHYGHDISRLVFGIWPVHPPLAFADGQTILSVSRDAMAPVRCGQGPVIDDDPRAAIVAVVTRSPAKMKLRTFLLEPVNLTTDIMRSISEQHTERKRNSMDVIIVSGIFQGIFKRTPVAEEATLYINHLRNEGWLSGISEVVEQMLAKTVD